MQIDGEVLLNCQLLQQAKMFCVILVTEAVVE
jgi:hypothetical protein